MNKPVWLRVMGWFVVALALFNGVQIYMAERLGFPPGSAYGIVFVGAPGTVLFLVWAWISAMLWFTRQKAFQNALAMKQAGYSAQAPPEAGADSLAGRFHHTVRRPAEVVTPTPQASPRPVMTSPLALSTLHPPPCSDPPPDPYGLIRGEACDTCGRDDVAPRFHCCRHETTVCFLCLVAHDARQECYYIPAGRAPVRRPVARIEATG